MTDEESRKHPATVRMDKTDADGNVYPFTVAEQWQQVSDWEKFLESDRASEFPVVDGFNEAWDELESLYWYGDKSIIERGADLKKVSGSPMSTLFYFIDTGFYPPPELLLTLLDCWETYMGSGGRMTLEEAFFGPTKKGAGNYANRKRAKYRFMHIKWEFDRLLRDGESRINAAEIISSRRGGKPDADSILRMLRGFHGLFARHHKAEK